ncbi:MAG: potassium transporter TrkG [Pseudomonadota bacterium]
MRIGRFPVIGILLGLLALMMLLPATQAAISGEWLQARGFLYPALFGVLVAASVSVLLRPSQARETARHELGMLILSWVVLSAYACLPLVLLTPQIGWAGAWFEMIAALTTTGGSVYTKASSVPDAIHLWRGLIGWFGGLLTLMGAYVVLAPRRLGGFEMLAVAEGLEDQRVLDMRVTSAGFESRAMRALRAVLPIYIGMTLVLGIIFNYTDKPGLIATVHAMSIISTSGITPVDGGFAASRNYIAEAAAALFMVVAATRLAYPRASRTGRAAWPWQDPELKLLLTLAGLASLLLFLRHWLGVLTVDVDVDSLDAVDAIWGAVFTSLSFITTTGFESHAWESARNWSGLANPGLILLGLCAIGGGAATTAGGIKLIRANTLIRHGTRELERIAVPLSVAGQGAGPRGLRREGAFIAWAFMMLFILALMASVLGLTLSGMRLTDALIASVAALSNTGPALQMISDTGLSFADLGSPERTILGIAMVLGRVETLAVIALFNPDNWGRSKKTGKSTGETPLSDW